MLIDMSSWKRSLQAYGIRTSEIWKIKEMINDPTTDQGCPKPVPAVATTSPHSWRTTRTWVLLRQPRHSYVCVRVLAMAISPHRLQTWTWYGSEASNSRSLRNWAAPWAIWQSRSISPKRRPPSLRTTRASQYQSGRRTERIGGTTDRDRPSIGWRLRIWTGPRALEWILSSTMCLRRW